MGEGYVEELTEKSGVYIYIYINRTRKTDVVEKVDIFSGGNIDNCPPKDQPFTWVGVVRYQVQVAYLGQSKCLLAPVAVLGNNKVIAYTKSAGGNNAYV